MCYAFRKRNARTPTSRKPPFVTRDTMSAFHGQKAYNGVAIVSRRPVTEAFTAFEDGETDDEARLIGGRVDDVWVVNTYVPQGRSPDDPAFAAKLAFFRRLRSLFERRFSPDRPVIWTGDLNVAPEPIDVFDPKRMDGQVGFHPDERRAWAGDRGLGPHRPVSPSAPRGNGPVLVLDYRLPKSLARNLGWRIDHIMVTADLARRAREVRHRHGPPAAGRNPAITHRSGRRSNSEAAIGADTPPLAHPNECRPGPRPRPDGSRFFPRAAHPVVAR